ncbi:hypothetical protein [Providencia phage PSTCR6]|nr:hypothetical protein [Providencia phage PSTCR6]
MMAKLTELRKSVSDIDDEIYELFTKRMGLVEQISDIKTTLDLPIEDINLEETKLSLYEDEAFKNVLRTIMLVSKLFQHSERALYGN